MAVSGPGSIQGSFPIKPTQSPSSAPVEKTAETKPISTEDKVEISSAGKMLENLNQSSEIRAERLAQIKLAIEAGEYDTPEKLELALRRMIAEVESAGEE